MKPGRAPRTAVTLGAILLGATVVTFAVGLSTSLNRVAYGLSPAKAEPVRAGLASAGPGGGIGAGGQRAIEQALRAQRGTLHYVAEAQQQVDVAGLAQPVPVTAFRGDPAWTGYDMISGHWYAGPGQVDVPAGFLAATGKAVGDTVMIISGGRRITVRIVGEVFATGNKGVAMFTGWPTLASADRGLMPGQYDIGLRPGTSAPAYAQALEAKLGPSYLVSLNSRSSGVVNLMIGLIGALTLLLAIAAGLGVLNTVALHIRERAHDLGIFKAVGMTSRQAIAMVVCGVAGTGLVAGVIAVPAGIALHRYVLPVVASSADLGLPTGFLNACTGWELGAVALAGVAIAAAGALLPAGWAAGIRTASALRAE
jgi:putative ABC transport system permease protein